VRSKKEKKQLIFVPGKNPKPPAAAHREQLWRCVLRGVEQVAPDTARTMAQQPGCFSLISWNSLYYNHCKTIEGDIPWIDRVIQAPGPTERDRKEVRHWRIRLAWLLYSVIARYPFLINLAPDPAVRATIKETCRYFENEGNIACDVRELLKRPLRQMMEAGDRILLIGHSMGSIISYDALWELCHLERNHGQVPLFLSLGSPLGLRYVQRRLQGARYQGARRYPGNISTWQNISAEGDLTALDVTLRDDFKEMIELGLTGAIDDHCEGVFNYFRNEKGLNAHRSYGYLVNPVVGRAIADWWHGE